MFFRYVKCFSGRGPRCPIWVRGTATLNMDHNLFWFPQRQNDTILEHGNITYDAASISTLGTGNIYGDPRFISPAWGTDGDYHLQALSPAIDAGATIASVTNDLDGNPRPIGSGYDIGAYESNYQSQKLGLALKPSSGRPGDKVTVELSPYDLTRGRIIYRYKR